jgi:hypothetical protein
MDSLAGKKCQTSVNQPLGTKAKLLVRPIIAQSLQGFIFIDQAFNKKFYGVENLIVGDTANHSVILACDAPPSSASHDAIKPFFRIACKLQDGSP